MPSPRKSEGQLPVKRAAESSQDSFDEDWACSPVQTTRNAAPESFSGMQMFFTASNKAIHVKPGSMEAARKKLRLGDDKDVSQWIQQDLEDESKNAVEEPPPPPMTEFTFQTANCKPIAVSEAAMRRARELVASVEENSENLANVNPNSAPQTPGAPLNRRNGFMSPLAAAATNNVVLSSSSLAAPSPISRAPGPNRFRTPFRPPSFVSPLVANLNLTDKNEEKQPATPLSSLALPNFSLSTPQATPSTSVTEAFTPTTPSTPVFDCRPLTIVSLSQLDNYLNDKQIDVIGVVDDVPLRQNRDSGLLQISFQLRDESGVSVKCDLFRRTDPGCLSRGDIVVLRKIVVKKVQGRNVLNAVVKSVLEVNPEREEVERLKETLNGKRRPQRPVQAVEAPSTPSATSSRLEAPSTPSSTVPSRLKASFTPFTPASSRVEPSTPSIPAPRVEAPETPSTPAPARRSGDFSYTNLVCVDRLKPTDMDIVVKGHLHEIKKDSMTYLGCIKCKRKIRPVDDVCGFCGSKESSHFFAVRAQLFDFSGILKVTIFDEAFSKLIDDDADEVARLQQYNPDELSEKLFSVEYARPRLFRLRRRDEDGWIVEDFKEIDYTTFNEYLGNIVRKKGYNIPKPLS